MKKSTLITTLILTPMLLTSCIRPYDKPEFQTIETYQTAFLLPLVGDTEDQASFQSEELLAKAMVASKEVQIPHRWVQMGRFDWDGEWRPSAKLIVVDRTPVTREWSSTEDTGTSKQNQAIYSEDADSIGFSVGMNCSAQIYSEEDAVKFLYSYNGNSLNAVMDTEIRAMVETKFVEEAGDDPMETILKTKDAIMDSVRKDVTEYFAKKGITITVLGYKDGIEYDDPSIQKAINDKLIAAQALEAQKKKNEAIVSQATAEAEAMEIAAQAEANANKLISESITPEILEMQKYEKWNGELPQYIGGDGENLIIKMD